MLIFLVFCVVLLCVFTFWVPCCDVRYDFHIKTMFGSSLPPVVCRGAHVLLTMFGSSLPPVVCRRAYVLFMFFYTLFVYSGVQHILCCGVVLFFFVLCTQCWQFLWNCPFFIAPSVFTNDYIMSYLKLTLRFIWSVFLQ